MAKRIITEADINKVVEGGKQVLECEIGACLVTPQAQDKAEEYGVEIRFVAPGTSVAPEAKEASAPVQNAPEKVVEPVKVAPVQAEAVPAAPVTSVVDVVMNENEALISQVCAILEARLAGVVDSATLSVLVRRVVTEKLAGAPVASVQEGVDACLGGLCVIDGSRLKQQGESPVAVAEQVFMADALGACPNAKLVGGYMEWKNASFNRTVESPEVVVVVEGELSLTMDGKTVSAKAGDMIYLPEGVAVTYATGSSVRLACINNAA